MADLKAVSQNLMHSSLQVTDSIYSVLSDADVGKRIAAVSQGRQSNSSRITREVITEAVEEALRHLE